MLAHLSAAFRAKPCEGRKLGASPYQQTKLDERRAYSTYSDCALLQGSVLRKPEGQRWSWPFQIDDQRALGTTKKGPQ